MGQLPLSIAVLLNTSETNPLITGSLQELNQLLGQNNMLFYLTFPFSCSLIALLLCIKFLHKRSILSLFTSRPSFDWKRFFVAFFSWGSILTLFLLIAFFSPNSTIRWHVNPATFFPLLLISLTLIPLQTTCEEVFFRGYLFQAFGHFYKKPWVAITLTGLIFGLLHAANPEVEQLGKGILMYYILTGVFLALLTHFDNGLELSMGYHAINNCFAALILTNNWQAFQTDALFIDYAKPSVGWDAIATVLIFQPVLLLLFSKLYKWKLPIYSH